MSNIKVNINLSVRQSIVCLQQAQNTTDEKITAICSILITLHQQVVPQHQHKLSANIQKLKDAKLHPLVYKALIETAVCERWFYVARSIAGCMLPINQERMQAWIDEQEALSVN